MAPRTPTLILASVNSMTTRSNSIVTRLKIQRAVRETSNCKNGLGMTFLHEYSLVLDWLQYSQTWDEEKAEKTLRVLSELKEMLRLSELHSQALIADRDRLKEALIQIRNSTSHPTTIMLISDVLGQTVLRE